MLERWERERTFERLREQNRGGPHWSFVDGPITANNPMGVHHAWGRTLKDVFQRYKALRGYDQRYQNGFDCQGLWVEVEVEKALGLNSKRDIEEYGLAEFTERCKERVAHFSEVITDQDRRLGRWMDWDNDYFTFSDTNIEYIWRFLRTADEPGWLYKGHRSTQWCPRCGTSLSQHEQAGEENYKELEHPSLFVRFPLVEREGEALRRLDDDPVDVAGERRRSRAPRRGVRAERGRLAPHGGRRRLRARGAGRGARRPPVPRPVRRLRGAAGDRAPGDRVGRGLALGGTGIVHIAPGAGTEDFELSRVHDLPVLVPIDEAAALPDYGALEGLHDRRGRAAGDRRAPRAGSRRCGPDHAPLPDLLALQDAARVPGGRRLVHQRRGDPTAPARRERRGRVDAGLLLEADGRLAAQHGRLEHLAETLLRAAAAVLPVRVRPPQRDRIARASSRSGRRAGSKGCASSTGRGSTTSRSRARRATARCGGIPEVGDAGSTRGSSRTRRSAGGTPSGRNTGTRPAPARGSRVPTFRITSTGRSGSPPTGSRRAASRSGSGRLDVLHVRDLDGRTPYRRVLAYERVRDETGREMHKSTGNAIEANEAIARMGADVMRWPSPTGSEPERQFRLRAGSGRQAPAAHLLELGRVPRHVREDRGLRPEWGQQPSSDEPLDRWLVARTGRLSFRPRTSTSATGRPASSVSGSRSSTTSRTGTSAARGGGSTATTSPRSRRSGTRSCRGCS